MATIASALPVSGFVGRLQEPRTPFISPQRFSGVLGVTIGRLAELAGVHRNTLRNPESERLQDRLREMVKVISAAASLAGDEQTAMFWFMNEPLSAYRHKTAAELVADGHSDAVMDYLGDLADGAKG